MITNKIVSNVSQLATDSVVTSQKKSASLKILSVWVSVKTSFTEHSLNALADIPSSRASRCKETKSLATCPPACWRFLLLKKSKLATTDSTVLLMSSLRVATNHLPDWRPSMRTTIGLQDLFLWHLDSYHPSRVCCCRTTSSRDLRHQKVSATWTLLSARAANLSSTVSSIAHAALRWTAKLRW